MSGDAISPTAFGWQIFRVGQAWRREVDLRMRRFGLTEATWRPLLHLGRLGEGVRQTDLAAAMDIEAPSLVRLLDVLEKADLVERVEDPEDRRSKHVRMTESGRALHAKLHDIYESLCRQFLSVATDQEIAMCAALLTKLEASIQATHLAADEA